MRFQVEVRDEYVDQLRRLAIKSHRSVREQAGYLLELKLEELAEPDAAEPVAEVA